jgi:rfaE bifunctional protein nucleotidyltransferase chain/domain
MSLIDKILSDIDDAIRQRDEWRSTGQKVVMTNGCFDLIHPGHVLYLEQAKSLGHKLIVALNSDASVSRLKGPHRPIHPLSARTTIMAALGSVDMVIHFEGDTPIDVIERLLPDVLVKGGDWTVDQIAGSDVVIAHGGEVRSLQFVDGHSTTAIESKIKGKSPN